MNITENNTANGIQTAKKKKRHYKKNGYPVASEELLYQIADAGLLCKLHGVNAGTMPRTYYFDFDPEVKSIVDKFKADNATA